MTPQQERLLKAVNNKLTQLLQKLSEPEKKPYGTWVTAKFIVNLTGWDKNEMVLARKNKWIEYRRSETGGYLYLLDSLNELFISKPKLK